MLGSGRTWHTKPKTAMGAAGVLWSTCPQCRGTAQGSQLPPPSPTSWKRFPPKPFPLSHSARAFLTLSGAPPFNKSKRFLTKEALINNTSL